MSNNSGAKGINVMPAPTSMNAPMFNGETSELFEFVEFFEDLTNACLLTDAEKCKLIVRYVDRPTKRFKDSILAQYPGAEKGVRYT